MNKSVYAFVVILALAVLLTACGSPAPSAPVVVTAPPQIVEVTKVVAGTPVTEKVVVTATPEPTANPYDDKAPLTVWIDQDRQPYIDAYKRRILIRPVSSTNQSSTGNSSRPRCCSSTTPTRVGPMWFLPSRVWWPRGRCGAQFPARP